MIQLSSLAVLFAFLHILVALPAIFSPHDFKKAGLKMASRVSHFRLMALPFFILSYLILELHPTVGKNWESVMSVLAYLMLIRGIVWMWWPDMVKAKVKKALKSDNGPIVIGLVLLALSLFVGYLGFYVYQ